MAKIKKSIIDAKFFLTHLKRTIDTVRCSKEKRYQINHYINTIEEILDEMENENINEVI